MRSSGVGHRSVLTSSRSLVHKASFLNDKHYEFIMTSKLIDKMLPSATKKKQSRLDGKATSFGRKGEFKEKQFPNILAKTKVKAREALNRLSSLSCGRSNQTVVLLKHLHHDELSRPSYIWNNVGSLHANHKLCIIY